MIYSASLLPGISNKDLVHAPKKQRRPAYRLVPAFIFFMTLSSITSAAATEYKKIVSRNRQFIVFAPDSITASHTAHFAEDIKEKLLHTLHTSFSWDTPAKIKIRYDADASPFAGSGTQPSSVTIERENYVSAWEWRPLTWKELLTKEIVKLTLCEIDLMDPSKKLPLWLIEGLTLNLLPREKAGFKTYMMKALKKNRYIPFEILFAIDQPLKDPELAELFLLESASLVDYLIEIDTYDQKKKRFLNYILSFEYTKEHSETILPSYSDIYPSLAQLESEWVGYAGRDIIYLSTFESRLTMEATKDRLEDILSPKKDSRNKEAPDRNPPGLETLFETKEPMARVQEVNKYYNKLQVLGSVCHEEYRDVIADYLDALDFVLDGNRKKFEKKLQEAERKRKELTKVIETRLVIFADTIGEVEDEEFKTAP